MYITQVEFLVYTSLTHTYAHIIAIHRYYNTLIINLEIIDKLFKYSYSFIKQNIQV